MKIDIVERLTAILHDTDLAMRVATLRLREAAAAGDLTPIAAIQWVGKDYRLAYDNHLCFFTKNDQDQVWQMRRDEHPHPHTWSITVRGILAELTRAVTRRNLSVLLLLGAGLNTGITADEWWHLLTRLAPARPPVNPWLAKPVLAITPAPSPAPLPAPILLPVPTKVTRRRQPVAAAPQPMLFAEAS